MEHTVGPYILFILYFSIYIRIKLEEWHGNKACSRRGKMLAVGWHLKTQEEAQKDAKQKSPKFFETRGRVLQ